VTRLGLEEEKEVRVLLDFAVVRRGPVLRVDVLQVLLELALLR
jgi:hypothetical protein